MVIGVRILRFLATELPLLFNAGGNECGVAGCNLIQPRWDTLEGHTEIKLKFGENLVDAYTKGKMIWKDKRRSQRIVLSVPVVAYRSQKQGLAFSEGTRTLVVSAHGALISLTAKVAIDQTLLLKNALTGEELECRVVFTQKKAMGSTDVGIEFREPAPGFWHIAFPPVDWASAGPGESEPRGGQSKEPAPKEPDSMKVTEGD
jgi:hypothetical protein